MQAVAWQAGRDNPRGECAGANGVGAPPRGTARSLPGRRCIRAETRAPSARMFTGGGAGAWRLGTGNRAHRSPSYRNRGQAPLDEGGRPAQVPLRLSAA